MSIDNILVRCSSIGKLFTEPKTNAAKAAGEMSETTKTYLSELYREYKYERRKDFTSKETEKGTRQEELGITLYSLQTKRFFKKNDRRLSNEFITGEPDIFEGVDIEHAEEGADTKCSWSLWSFPFEEQELKKDYYWQNMGYMALTGASKWNTVYALVNAPADQILSEKQKIWYAMGMPDESDERYIAKRIEVEKNMIFDMKQFKSDNPGFDLDIKDWRYDIPRDERIKIFTVLRNEDEIQRIYDKVRKARAYMQTTYESISMTVKKPTLMRPRISAAEVYMKQRALDEERDRDWKSYEDGEGWDGHK